MSSLLPLLFTGLVAAGITACSSDSDTTGDDDAKDVCVKVQNYTVDNEKDGDPIECAAYPAECADAEDGCGEPGDACDRAVRALCKAGAERNTCVSASLNDVVVSVEITCQPERPLP